MRVVVHGVADDAGDLGEAAIVLLPHGVEDAALNGLEAVLDGGEGTVADGIGGELEEVVVHQAAEGAAVADVRDGAGGGRLLRGGGGVGLFLGLFGRGVLRGGEEFVLGVVGLGHGREAN